MSEKCEYFSFCFGFILVVVGFVVGIGNLVGFFVLVIKNGGGVFFLVYVLFVIFICLFVMMVEMVMG